jgi:hypothetical protein
VVDEAAGDPKEVLVFLFFLKLRTLRIEKKERAFRSILTAATLACTSSFFALIFISSNPALEQTSKSLRRWTSRSRRHCG